MNVLNTQNLPIGQEMVTGNRALMFVYTPKMMPTQILRPYVYNFNNGLINDVNERIDMESNGYARTKKTDNMLKALAPLPNGVRLDTSMLNEYWTFMLTVDYKEGRHGASRRFLASGYFIDEPFARTSLGSASPVVNPAAMMVWTHHTNVSIAGHIDPGAGHRNYTSVNVDADDVSQAVGAHMADDICTITPGDIRKYMNKIGSRNIGVPGDLLLNNMTAHGTSIPSNLKSPSHHFGDIYNKMYAAVGAAGEIPLSTFSSTDDWSGSEAYYTYLDDELTGSDISTIGIDTKKPISLQQLMTIIPNIVVKPLKLPRQSEWEIKPQDAMTQEVTMSSMVASTVSAIASNCNLLNINFRYCSYSSIFDKTTTDLSQFNGTWEILPPDPQTIVKVTEFEYRKTLNYFQKMMMSQLFNVLKSFGGEFDLMCSFNAAGETLVNLKYMDELSMSNGFYETNNRFASFVTPNLGNIQLLDKNASELNNLINNVADIHFKTFGGAELVNNHIDITDDEITFRDSVPVPDNDTITLI